MEYGRKLVFIILLGLYYSVATRAETVTKNENDYAISRSNSSTSSSNTQSLANVTVSSSAPTKEEPKAVPNVVSTTTAAVTKNSTTPKCVCDGALLPRLGENGKELEVCPECKCQHEARNTTLIKVVVIIVIWIISILVIYMLFLMCLDPLLNKRVKANYQEHTNEDDDTSVFPPLPTSNNQELNSRANVLNRVGHQQDKWKRQVREQRRHIYDRRTMLN